MMHLAKKIRKNLRRFYILHFMNYQSLLEKSVSGCESLLDIGCGSASPIRFFSRRISSVGIDVFAPAVEESRRKRIHDNYLVMDARDISRHFKENSFDCILASDIIEHLPKEHGIKLLFMMEKIARKRVIVFTPNGFLRQRSYDSNPWQAHMSGWTADEMKKRGYRVIGINGLKFLRGERALIRFWPEFFWKFISVISEHYVKDHPEKAFQLLCIKDKAL